MIQRLQTLFLVLAVICNVIVYFTPLYQHAMNDPANWIGFGFAVMLAVSVLDSIYAIFLYKDRKKQRTWVKRGMMVQVIALAIGIGIVFSLGGIGTYLWDEVLAIGLVIGGLLFQYLAVHFISKDIELVKSMDRIR